jgi:hypothetical protein
MCLCDGFRRIARAGVRHDHRAPRAEASECVPLLDGQLDRRAHDWLVVTLLTVPPLDLPLELELELESDEELVPEVESEPDDELVLGELDATVLAADCLASAGSCPDTSTTVISSHAATNSATDPAMMRRRSIRARARRASRIARPRA